MNYGNYWLLLLIFIYNATASISRKKYFEQIALCTERNTESY